MMFAVTLDRDADEAAFRAAARTCIAHALAPADVAFVSPDQPALLPPLVPRVARDVDLTVPRAYAALMRDAICHSAADRFALLYGVLWRILAGERDLAGRASDRQVARLMDYAHSVRRDIHKMHAFLRFRESEAVGRKIYSAWFEPHHHILRRAVPFFVDRFSNMDFLIATPRGIAVWSDRMLSFGPPADRPSPGSDEILDGLWLTYYRTTFNPARLRLKTMVNHMPRDYWNNMPETAIIPDMVTDAEKRVAGMMDMPASQPELFAERIANRRKLGGTDQPHEEGSLAAMRSEAQGCTRCPLYRNATQTVFGEGPRNAPVVFVGEQPGDQEDLAGKPFVGPAGQLFDRALAEAGLDRGRAYVTNAVKHFKYEPRGKRRIHKKPNAGEVRACRFWLDGELSAIKPDLVVALGGTAAQALAQRPLSVTKVRGPFDFEGQPGFITVHPSYLLRLTREPGDETAKREYAAFVRDLKRIGELAPAIRA